MKVQIGDTVKLLPKDTSCAMCNGLGLCNGHFILVSSAAEMRALTKAEESIRAQNKHALFGEPAIHNIEDYRWFKEVTKLKARVKEVEARERRAEAAERIAREDIERREDAARQEGVRAGKVQAEDDLRWAAQRATDELKYAREDAEEYRTKLAAAEKVAADAKEEVRRVEATKRLAAEARTALIDIFKTAFVQPLPLSLRPPQIRADTQAVAAAQSAGRVAPEIEDCTMCVRCGIDLPAARRALPADSGGRHCITCYVSEPPVHISKNGGLVELPPLNRPIELE